MAPGRASSTGFVPFGAVLCIAAVLVSLPFGAAGVVQAAETVLISGRVADSTGAPIAYAQVVLRSAGVHAGTSAVRTVRDGRFGFRAQVDRTYELRIAAPGFRQRTVMVKTATEDIELGNLAPELSVGCPQFVPYDPAPLPTSLDPLPD